MSPLLISTTISLSLLISTVANAGVSRSGSFHCFSGHASRNSINSHSTSRISNVNHSGSTSRSNHSITHTGSTSFTQNNGNSVSHNGSTTVSISDDKTIEHSGKVTEVSANNHESIHRDASTSVSFHADGSKDLDHVVSAESNSVGTIINGHKAETHVSKGNVTHEGWAVINQPDGITSYSHNGKTSINRNSDDSIEVHHSDTTAKFIEESLVKEHEVVDKTIIIK